MKKIKLNFNKRLALLLSALLFMNLVFSDALLFANAADGTSVQGDYNGDGNLELGDLVDWVNEDKSSSDDANSLRTELLRIVDTSVENDDGTFEGNEGIISICNANVIGASGQTGAAPIEFQSVETTDGGHKLHVKGKGGNANTIEMLYIKFNQKVESGATYKVSLDFEALDTDYKKGLWKYCFTDQSMKLGSLVASKEIANNKEAAADALFTKGYTFEFTSTKDSDSFCLVFWELSSNQVRMNFTIDNIRLEGSTKEVHTIEKVAGNFEGDSGNVSFYCPRTQAVSEQTSNAFIWYQKMITNEGTKLHVRSQSSSGTNTDMMLMKFNQKVENGVTYRVSMDLDALDDTYISGTWKYAFTDTTIGLNTMGGPKTIADNNETDAKAIFTKGYTFEFTATKDCDYFYLAFWERSDKAIWLNFTIDNIKLTRVFPSSTSVLNDDGTFEGKQGSVSLYSVSALTAELGSDNVNQDARWQNDIVTFQRIETENGLSVSIKSSDVSSDRGGLVYIKFANKLKANTEYTISYNAKWTGETLPTATNGEYAILQSASKWVTSVTNPIVTFRKPQTGSMFDGTATVTFTPTEDYDEFYLVLHLQNGDVNFDMEIDNIRVDKTYLLGIGEGTSEINTEVESTLAIDYVSEVTGVMGAKSYRLWMRLNNVLSVDENNNVIVNQPVAATFHRMIDSLKAQGVERFVCTSSNYLYPYGYATTNNHVIPNPKTEPEQYQEFLKILKQSYLVIAREFPDICYFEPGNEPNHSLGQNICQNGYQWSADAEDNAPYLYTEDETARILCDLMWYTKQAVTEVDNQNQVLIPGLSGYKSETRSLTDYLNKIYVAIESGEFPTGAAKTTDPDDYFDILNWHPYLLPEHEGIKQMDDTWMQFQKDVYQVAVNHGDGEKAVWFTEMGFSDRGDDERLNVTAENMVKMFEYVTNELDFVETVFLFRVSNLTGSASVSTYEDNIGLFYSLNDDDETVAGQPKPMTVALYKWLYGENVDLTPLYALADWQIDGKILANAVRNDDGTFEGTSGIYSLLTPELIKGSEGERWASSISFKELIEDGQRKVQVTSDGKHGYDYLYIKVNQPIQANCNYSVTMDVKELDTSGLNGSYGYWILSPDAKTSNCIQTFSRITSDTFFKENVTFEFTSNGDYDYFYLVLREDKNEVQFNFSIDNIRFQQK